MTELLALGLELEACAEAFPSQARLIAETEPFENAQGLSESSFGEVGLVELFEEPSHLEMWNRPIP